LLQDPNDKNHHNGSNSDLGPVIGYLIQFHHVKISETNECGKDANNISFSSPLSTLTSHEVLGDDHRSILVSLIFEPWHIVEGGIYDSSSANDPYDDRNGEPHHLIQEDWIKLFDHIEQDSQNCEEQDVLGDDAEKGKLDLDIGV